MSDQFTYLRDFIDRMDIVCPHCEKRAVVISQDPTHSEARCLCTHCGLNKTWPADLSGSHKQEKGILLGAPVDCYFRIPLWYRTEYAGEVLFAYNLSHLNFLKEYVESKSRSRTKNALGWSNTSMQSRLPKWMLLAKNREAILKKIRELEQK